jgi:tRNA threonylcarbamoyladenosine biosynthesis protein TsaE
MNITYTLEQLTAVANQVLEQNPNKIILFVGEMGVGKTTLIKELARQLGVSGATSSPTFSLVNEYLTNENQTIYHFDFYRLKKEVEALDMGVDEYLYSGHWCFVEWSEKIPNLIPETHTVITIELLSEGKRLLKIS